MNGISAGIVPDAKSTKRCPPDSAAIARLSISVRMRRGSRSSASHAAQAARAGFLPMPAGLAECFVRDTAAEGASTLEIRQAKQHFPGTRDKTFLDAACVGLAPTQARIEIERFLDRALMCPDRDASTHHIALDQARATAVREGARLLEAEEDEIALVESTTHGLNVLAAAIPFEPSDNVVICDLEFLQVAIPWLKLAERGGIQEVRLVHNHEGAVPVEAFAEHVDDDTRAVVVSSVQWTNGFAVDLRGWPSSAARTGRCSSSTRSSSSAPPGSASGRRRPTWSSRAATSG